MTQLRPRQGQPWHAAAISTQARSPQETVEIYLEPRFRLIAASVTGSADFAQTVFVLECRHDLADEDNFSHWKTGGGGRNLTNFNVDGFRLGLFALRETHFQRTLLELRAELIASGALGESKAPHERAVGAFHAVILLASSFSNFRSPVIDSVRFRRQPSKQTEPEAARILSENSTRSLRETSIENFPSRNFDSQDPRGAGSRSTRPSVPCLSS